MVEGAVAGYQSAGSNAVVEITSPPPEIFAEDWSTQPFVRKVLPGESVPAAPPEQIEPIKNRASADNPMTLIVLIRFLLKPDSWRKTYLPRRVGVHDELSASAISLCRDQLSPVLRT